MEHFILENFGPIRKADVGFGDLTILIGPQASGKSLYLEMLKLMIDRNQILEVLRKYNYIVDKYDSRNIVEIYFGEGMGNIIRDETATNIDGEAIDSSKLLKLLRTPSGKGRTARESVFYIPAQRIMSVDDGRARNFMEFNISSPYVLRNFSETLRIFVQGGLGNPDVIFPMNNRLKGMTKRAIDDSIFHNSQVIIDKSSGQRKMKLSVDRISIPFMAWSAGQKEFLPLLLSFYYLSKVPNSIAGAQNYQTVIIEEPEMGLHPKAILSVIMEIIDLMAAGYRIIISTHSPVFLEFAWAFNELQKVNLSHEEMVSTLCDMFEVKRTATIARSLDLIAEKKVSTFLFSPGRKDHKVVTKDISSLDAGDSDPAIAEWGGLSHFSAKVTDAVLKHAGEDL